MQASKGFWAILANSFWN